MVAPAPSSCHSAPSVAVTAVLAVSVAAATAAWWVYQRRRPPYLDQLHRKDVSTHSNVKQKTGDIRILPVRRLDDTDAEVLTLAFRKNRRIQWMYNQGRPIADDDSILERQELNQIVSHTLQVNVKLTETYGHVVKAVQEGVNDITTMGIMLVIPPESLSYLYSTYSKRIRWICPALPKCLTEHIDRMDRLHTFQEGASKHHLQFIQERPNHWYLMDLGVSPKAQGQGIGTLLLDYLMTLAADAPIYLECYKENVAFYQKRGFVVTSSYILQAPPRKGSAGQAPKEGFPFYSMVHYHRSLL